MESKYYVPSIEEFRVGFQYEELMGTESSGLQDWSEKIFDISEYIDRNGEHYLLELINGECIRVNYLDQSDIENLGWIFEGSQIISNGRKDYRYNEYILSYIPSNNHYAITTKSQYGDTPKVLFNGIIKNVNELKVLLKQLGIE
jgi:hypothetical protein